MIGSLSPTLRRTLILFCGLGLSVPSGVLLARLLSYELGAEAYGVVGVTVSIIFWLELSSTQLFGRAIVRFVSVADDWRGLGARLLRIQLALGVAVLLVITLLAPLVADVLRTPALRYLLPLLALDIPLYTLAQAQGSLLIARGRAWSRSALYMVRWIGRLVWVIVFLRAGYGLEAPLRGYLAASLLEVLVGFALCRVPLLSQTGTPAVPLGEFMRFAAPVWVYTMTLELFGSLDLLMIQAAQPGSVAAGHYAAVQYLTTLPDLIAASLSPVLIGTLAPQIKAGQLAAARTLIRNTIRLIFGVLPFAGIAAGSSAQIIPLIFAPEFREAAPVLTILLIGSVGFMLIVVGTAMLTALNVPNWTGALSALLLPLALIGHLWIIPVAGSVGAALITASLAWVGGLTVVIAVCGKASIRFPGRDLVLAVGLTVISYGVSATWIVDGWVVLLKMSALGMIMLAGSVLGLRRE